MDMNFESFWIDDEEEMERNEANFILVPIDAIEPLSTPLGEPGRRIQALIKTAEKNGAVPPVCVYKTLTGKYELLTGGQRIALAIKAGISEIHAVICNPEDEYESVLAIIRDAEGVLNCFQEADYLKRMIESGNYSQRSLADKIGKSQSYVSNKLRLSRMSPALRKRVLEGGLTERHARQLLRIGDEKAQKIVADYAVKRKLTVEKMEEKINEMLFENGATLSRDYAKALERYLNEIKRVGDKIERRDKKMENSEKLRLLISVVSEIVDITRLNGLLLYAGQRNTDNNVEIIIKIPRAENNVSLKANMRPMNNGIRAEEKKAA